jgi:PAS domain S-box-containing protein
MASGHAAELDAAPLKALVIAGERGAPALTGPPGDEVIVAHGVTDGLAMLDAVAVSGRPFDAIVIAESVERPLEVARQVHQAARAAPVVLATDGSRVRHFQRMLPFVPHIGDVSIADTRMDAVALRRFVAEAAAAAHRRREVSGLFARINRQIAPVSAASDEARERRLMQSDRFLASLLAHVPDAILATDIDGSIVAWNDAASLLFGRSADDIAGRPVVSLFAEEKRSPLAALLDHAKSGDVVRAHQTEVLLPDQSTRSAEVILAPVYDQRGSVTNAFLIVRDITDRIAAENQLHRSQRMEAVGHLTGGLAHDFNNLLTAVIGNLDLLEQHLAKGDPAARELADQAMKAALRGASLVRELLSFAGRQPLRPTAVDLNELVTNMLVLLRRSLGETVTIETRLAPDLNTARVDRSQLETALLNLCLNARDAMPEGGCLTIETARVSVHADRSGGPGELVPGDYIKLTVADTGVGMVPEVQAHAFEPFFTTKEVGKGSGLGLSMVYGFAKQSEGHVELRSDVGRGTTVDLYLPMARTKPNPARADAGDAERTEPATILVVEDDADVRAVAVGILRGLSYRVLEAPDGPSALQILRQTVSIDLLFTDVVMPGGISGPQLAKRAQAERPQLKVLFATGYSDAAITRGGRDALGGDVVAKPYRRADLAPRIRRLLEVT